MTPFKIILQFIALKKALKGGTLPGTFKESILFIALIYSYTIRKYNPDVWKSYYFERRFLETTFFKSLITIASKPLNEESSMTTHFVDFVKSI